MSKHITSKEMKIIESNLDNNTPLKDIAISVQKDPRAVSRHIKKYRVLFIDRRLKNTCAKQASCEIKHLCNKCPNGRCKDCSFRNCNSLDCPEYSEIPECKKLEQFPFVCNGCPDERKCKLPKYFYDSEKAYVTSRETLINSRSHIQTDDIDLAAINVIVSPLIKRGISLEVILATHPEIGLSLSTLYTYINNGLLSVKNIDLKRKVRYKKRIKNNKAKITYNYLNNRYYENFVDYISQKSSIYVWELDTIEGVKGGKAVMSLLYRMTNLQLFFLIDSIDQDEIIRVFDKIKLTIGDMEFKKYFPVILTDRGKEFKDPLAIEYSKSGEKLCDVFYCDSRQSQQKGKCEKNHEHFREKAKKGTSFDEFTQEKIDEISLHVNNYPRPILNMRSPYYMSTVLLNENILSLNHLHKIEIEDVNLK